MVSHFIILCAETGNKKSTLSPSRDKVHQHSAVPLSVVCPLRKQTAPRPLSRADAVTGINRPHLLASSFSRRLQGDFHPSPLSAFHQTAALFAGGKGVLVPIHARTIQFLAYDITFGRFVNGFYEKRAPNGALLRVFPTY